MLLWLILPLQLFLRNQVGEGSKQGIKAAWSTPIHHVKWWISFFWGIYRALAASEGGCSFWYYFRDFGHYVMSQGAPCWLLWVFYIWFCILLLLLLLLLSLFLLLLLLLLLLSSLFFFLLWWWWWFIILYVKISSIKVFNFF